MPKITLINETTFSDKKLAKLIKFAKPYFPSLHLATILVLPKQMPEPGVGGLASKFDLTVRARYPEQIGPNDPFTPSSIQLWVPCNVTTQYPVITEYRKKVGPVQLESMDEELLFVLAHEARHIEQFWCAGKMPYHYEVDAEKYAKHVLEEYRNYVKE